MFERLVEISAQKTFNFDADPDPEKESRLHCIKLNDDESNIIRILMLEK